MNSNHHVVHHRFSPRDHLVRAFICLFALNMVTGNGIVRALGITQIHPGETIAYIIRYAGRMAQIESAEEWFTTSHEAIPSSRTHRKPPPIESLLAKPMPR